MYTYMYMGKNYTLYIRIDKFATEANKGGLINELLERHYGSPGRVISVNKKPTPIFKKSNILPGQTVIPPTPIEINILEHLPVTTADQLNKLCSHGAHPKFCRMKKNGKDCK